MAIFHWLTAAPVIAVYLISEGGPDIRKDPPSIHIRLGLTVLTLTLPRLLWCLFCGVPRLGYTSLREAHSDRGDRRSVQACIEAQHAPGVHVDGQRYPRSPDRESVALVNDNDVRQRMVNLDAFQNVLNQERAGFGGVLALGGLGAIASSSASPRIGLLNPQANRVARYGFLLEGPVAVDTLIDARQSRITDRDFPRPYTQA